MGHVTTAGPAPSDRSPGKFFVWVLVLGIPFSLLGALTGGRLPANLPVSALGFICPLVAAVICVRGERGGAGVRELFRRVFDHARVGRRAWYVPILLLMPAITFASYWLMRLAGRPLPEPELVLVALPVYLAVAFAAAACEELGWTGYAADPMQERWGPVRAGVVIGLVWAAWHVVPYLQVRDAAWTAWQVLFTVAARVVIVWLYDNAGRSLFATILCHASINVSYSLFPVDGSHYEPAFAAPIAVLVAAILVSLRPRGQRRARDAAVSTGIAGTISSPSSMTKNARANGDESVALRT